MKDYAIIMAGGIGERLWPLSRESKPKQLLSLYSDKSMIAETLDRIEPLVPIERVLLVCGENMKNMIKAQHTELTDENFLVEPMRRNTASAILYAASYLKAKVGDAMMFVLTSDHFIEPRQTFIDSLKVAKEVAATDRLVLLGVEPTRPETGYGYIEVDLDKPLEGFESDEVYLAKSFKEKPNRASADQYFIGQNHLWNSGMFIWKASTILASAKLCVPELAHIFDEYECSVGTDNENDILKSTFEKAEKISIDKGIMERSTDIAVVRANFTWDDLGSWMAFPRIFRPDQNSNTLIGESKSMRSYTNIIYNKTDKPIVTLGVSDLVIVNTDDVIFVMKTSEHGNMAKLLERLRDDEDFKKHM